MIRVAICDNDRQTRLKLRNAVERYADSMGVCNVEAALLESIDDLETAIAKLRKNYFDLVICNLDWDDDSGVVDKLKVLHDACPSSEFATYSTSEDKAIFAYDIVSEFFLIPCSADTFERAIASKLRDVAERKKSLFGVKTAKGLHNVDLRGVTFIESSKKGPIIHGSNGQAIVTRGSLLALYERLGESHPQFVKAGGSFIVNLDNIRTIGQSSVIFGDGETVILPVRARKTMKDSFDAYRLEADA